VNYVGKAPGPGVSDSTLVGYQKKDEKGVADGYAALDGTGVVPDGQIPPEVTRDTELAAAISAHVLAPDPHPQYLTVAEGDAAYELFGAVAAHVALPDPHAQYLTSAEGNAAYAPIGQMAAHIAADDHVIYLNRDGSRAMTGQLTLFANPVLPAQAANKAYVDATVIGINQVTTQSNATGDAQLTVQAAWNAQANAAGIVRPANTIMFYRWPSTLQNLYRYTGTQNGPAGWASVATDWLQTTGIVEAPNDGQSYGRKNLGWENVTLPINAGIAAHVALADPHPVYLTSAEGNAAYEVIGAVAAHVALADPHVQYQKESEKGVANGYASLDSGGTVPDAQISALIARDTEVTAAINAHVALPDPHPQYLTSAEGNAAYEAFGAVAAHVALADPHVQYQKESEREIASGYAGLDAQLRLTGVTRLPLADTDGKFLVRRAGAMTYAILLDADIPATIARDSEVTSALSAYVPLTQKAAANGVASLDSSGVVPDAQIPAAIARDSEVTAAIATHSAQADPHTVYQLESQKAVANGYASLDGTGKVPSSQIPVTPGGATIEDAITYAVALG